MLGKCASNVGKMCLKCWENVPQMLGKCASNVGEMFLKCWGNVPQMFLKFSSNVPPMFLQCASNVGKTQYNAVDRLMRTTRVAPMAAVLQPRRCIDPCNNILFHFTGPPVPITARMHSTPQIDPCDHSTRRCLGAQSSARRKAPPAKLSPGPIRSNPVQHSTGTVQS
eukprot:1180785-Pyramimonas_sp.AAC.1